MLEIKVGVKLRLLPSVKMGLMPSAQSPHALGGDAALPLA